MKLFKDTLTGPDGKYSRKSVTALTAFIAAGLIGILICLSDLIMPENKTINEYAITVFFGFLAMAGGTTVLTVIDKMKKFGGGGKKDDEQ